MLRSLLPSLAAVMRRDFQRYGQIVRAANVTAD